MPYGVNHWWFHSYIETHQQTLWNSVEENDLFTKDREKPLWLTKFESFYENCEVHDIEYTKEIYKESFHSELDKDYEIIDVIASGSIGQVYKLKQGDKFSNEQSLI